MMDMNVQDTAKAKGWDLEGTLRRFGGSQMMLERFLKKFPQDPTFGKLEEAAEQGDLPGIETAAHTLKGIAGNLGLTALYEGCSSLVAAVRAGETQRVPGLWETVRAEYQAAVSAVAQIEW